MNAWVLGTTGIFMGLFGLSANLYVLLFLLISKKVGALIFPARRLSMGIR